MGMLIAIVCIGLLLWLVQWAKQEMEEPTTTEEIAERRRVEEKYTRQMAERGVTVDTQPRNQGADKSEGQKNLKATVEKAPLNQVLDDPPAEIAHIDRRFVLVGRFDRPTATVTNTVASLGGRVMSQVSGATDYVIIGNAWDGKITKALKQAFEYRSQYDHLQIVSERQWLDSIAWKYGDDWGG